MKHLSAVILCTVLLVLLFVAPSVAASSPSVACLATPPVGPIGTVFSITCTGFAPGMYTTAWFTEPTGVAFTWPGQKTDATGTVTYSFLSQYDSIFDVALGQYAFTIKQNDLIGVAYFEVTGGNGAVTGGITMLADPAAFHPGEATLITAAGFAPGEMVSVWFDFPNADCASMTAHGDYIVNAPFAIGGGFYEGGVGTMIYATVRADANGAISFPFEPFSELSLWTLCVGDYHVVAQGVTSGLSGDITVTMIGNPTVATATLVAEPATVVAMFGTVTFNGSGFGANENLNCWNTTPQGATIIYDPLGTPLRANGNGDLSFSIFTGAFSPELPVQSEGALGEWAMSCKGATTGLVGIAYYTVVGNVIDP